MRLVNSIALTRQSRTQASGSDASSQFAQAGGFTQLTRHGSSVQPAGMNQSPLSSMGSALFVQCEKTPPFVFNHLRALSFALLHAQNSNSFIFILPRALWAKTPGVGVAKPPRAEVDGESSFGGMKVPPFRKIFTYPPRKRATTIKNLCAMEFKEAHGHGRESRPR